MGFNSIRKKIKYASGLSERFKLLDAYSRMLDGTFYDHLKYDFDDEWAGGEYIQLKDRRPSVQFNIPHEIATQTGNLIWCNQQTPKVSAPGLEEETSALIEKNIEKIIDILNLPAVMLEAMQLGNVGSVCIIVRAKKNGLPMFEVVSGKGITPIFDPFDPDELKSIVNMYSAQGSNLLAFGYTHDSAKKEIKSDELYWMRIVIDAEAEQRFLPLNDDDFQQLDTENPQRVDGTKIEWLEDENNHYPHDFGCVPAVWIRNLVTPKSKGIDGDCTFGKIVDLQVKIDRLLSQNCRGLEYTSDPTMVITTAGMGPQAQPLRPAGAALTKQLDGKRDEKGSIVKSPTNELYLAPGAEAKYLEINGQGIKETREMILMLREFALEVIGGMRSTADNQASAQSGRAIELLYQTLIILVKQQRIAYGDRGLIPLLRIISFGIKNEALTIPDVTDFDTNLALKLLWPDWLDLKSDELLASAQAWTLLAGGSQKEPVMILPPQVVSQIAANELGIHDTISLRDKIEKAQEEKDQRTIEIQTALKPEPTDKTDIKSE